MTDRARVSEPFHEASQQHEAAMMGMYVFLAAELMLFGGLFAVAFVARALHPQEVVEASKRLHVWIGAINTAILLTSSLAVAIAVDAARAAAHRRTAAFLAAAAGLGLTFLGLKAYEYSMEYAEGLLPGFGEPTNFSGPVEHLFMNLYLIATSLHAVHLAIGICLVLAIAWRVAYRSLRLPRRVIVVETTGLYWHLVDVVWVFLYPILYLAR